MNKLPKALHYSLLLIILGVIVGVLLSFTNKFTAPIIEENKLKTVQPMLEEFAPDAKVFEMVTNKYQNLAEGIQNIYVAYADEEKTVQQAVIIYVVTKNQYGDIESLIAIDAQKDTFINIKFVASSQTKGYGDVDLLNKLDFNLKGQSIDSNIDGYARASFTTASIEEAVEIAVKFYTTQFEKTTQIDELLEAIKVKMPTAVTYHSIKSDLTVDNDQILDIYAVYNESEDLLGVVYLGAAKGYENGEVQTLVVINTENDQFIGIQVYQAKKQSRGIGDLNTLNGYYKDFGNVSVDETIDTVVEATESTSAVKTVVDLARAHYKVNSEAIKGLEG